MGSAVKTLLESLRGLTIGAALALAASSMAAAPAAPDSPDNKKADEPEKPEAGKFEPFKAESKISTGSVTIGGQAIGYQAIAGTFVIHPRDWDDVPRDPKADKDPAAAQGDAAN